RVRRTESDVPVVVDEHLRAVSAEEVHGESEVDRAGGGRIVLVGQAVRGAAGQAHDRVGALRIRDSRWCHAGIPCGGQDVGEGNVQGRGEAGGDGPRPPGVPVPGAGAEVPLAGYHGPRLRHSLRGYHGATKAVREPTEDMLWMARKHESPPNS